MDKSNLKKFIYSASRATYASGNDSIKQKQLDGSTTIEFTEGDYRYHDNYFGGEPYGGREVVFYKNEAKWIMVYYGLVYEGVNEEVYSFLVKSLSNNSEDNPYRGPEEYKEGEWTYTSELKGDVENFTGEEKIFKGNKCVYKANYMGGLLNK